MKAWSVNSNLSQLSACDHTLFINNSYFLNIIISIRDVSKIHARNVFLSTLKDLVFWRARMEEARSALKMLTGTPAGKRPLGRPRQEIHFIIQSKHSGLLDFFLRVWKLKYIKQ